MERLTDLDELVLRCKTETARGYVSDAVNCYRGGAYRACIVSTWIAVVFDLIDKLRELSISGNAVATTILNQFEQYQAQISAGNMQGIKSALEFEREIITTVKDQLQFFDQQELTDLIRLREDRHRCAHPSFQKAGQPYRPSAEQARMHLRNAVTHVLSQSPVQGRSAIDEVMVLVSSNYFPSDRTQARTHIEHSAVARATEGLVKGVTDALFFKYFEPNQPLLFSQNIVAALGALLDIHRPVVEARLVQHMARISTTIDDHGFLGVVLMAFDLPELWELSGPPVRNKILNFITAGEISQVIAFLKDASEKPELHNAAVARINELGVDQLSSGIINHHLGRLAIPKALGYYRSVGSWNSANEISEKLIIPLFEQFTPEEIDEVLRIPRDHRADLVGSTGYMKFIQRLHGDPRISEAQLRQKLNDYGLEFYVRQLERAGET
ncbi:hypothetical protein [Gallaecimonas pentaromativorans]|uniref:Uncharacterized protein n=1 Tax=Gallaecimonas pentaromativorans TaxID=584787 RepID=A0A3N1PP19_9GAMM|nr:hypothetical protein [Gallaecimonas pentaromativorans]ROQ28871.1 hypothetical protein EDC28_103469 [Gallaecimonas pentaromativorans]